MNLELNERLDQNLESFEKGFYFSNKQGDFEDLNDFLLLNISVDTVRQIYTGTISRDIDLALHRLTEFGSLMLEKEEINNNKDITIRRFNIPFDCKLTRMGKNSGYRYKLQNNQIGIVVMIGSYFKRIEEEFSHLKIELSPHFISSRTPVEIQEYMDNVSGYFLENGYPSAVAPHLCVDFQGWDIPLDMQDHIVTRSKRIRSYRGIDEIKFDGLQDAVLVTYGRAETLMVGNANALQLSLYRKDLEIIKTDKIDYCHGIWEDYSLGSFDATKPVIRAEFRFHHSVIKEFERGIGEDINTYIEVEQYLNDLWQYALKTIRYQKKSTVAPIWQVLMQDITFNSGDIRENFKRQQKAKISTQSITRNLGLFIGNYLSIRARTGIAFKYVQKEIQNMPVMEQIRNNLLENRHDEGHYFQQLEQKYLERKIASKYSMVA